MSKLSRNLATPTNGQDTLHPREVIFGTGVIAAAASEVIIPSDGCNIVSLDLRDVAVLTIELSGSVDGVNWTLIPVRPINLASVAYLAAVVYPAGGGVWMGVCSGYRLVRARCTAFTSGSVVVTLAAQTSVLDPSTGLSITPLIVTNTGAAAAAVTLTLPAPGAGVRQYVTYLSITRFATALLTAGAAPVLVTTTNLPGAVVFNFPADAAAQGTIDRWREDFAYPLAASAQNTAVTFICPATTAVIWRVTTGYFIAP